MSTDIAFWPVMQRLIVTKAGV